MRRWRQGEGRREQRDSLKRKWERKEEKKDRLPDREKKDNMEIGNRLKWRERRRKGREKAKHGEESIKFIVFQIKTQYTDCSHYFLQSSNNYFRAISLPPCFCVVDKKNIHKEKNLSIRHNI